VVDLKSKNRLIYGLTAFSLLGFAFSFHSGYEPGINIAENYFIYFKFILTVIPAVFMILGLANVWIKKETVMKHMGDSSGIKGYLWAVLFSSTTVGGIFVVYPIAASLYQKNAKMSVILTYIGSAAVCRIPMTMWEISMLGIAFTLTRYAVSLPLIIIVAIAVEKLFFSKTELENIKENISKIES